MKPKWPKLASLAQQYAHSSYSSSVQSLLPKDNLFKNIFESKMLKFVYLCHDSTEPLLFSGSGGVNAGFVRKWENRNQDFSRTIPRHFHFSKTQFLPNFI